MEIHGAPENSVIVWRPSIAEWAPALMHTLGRHCPTRAALLKDQIQELLKAESNRQLVCVAAASGRPDLAQSVLAIVDLTPGIDTASILHVDWAYPALVHPQSRSTVGQAPSAPAQCESEILAVALWQELAAVFSMTGVRFVQWATAPVRSSDPNCTIAPSAAARWSMAMNFTQMGTLEYLSFHFRPVDANKNCSGVAHRERRRIHCQPLDVMDQTTTPEFEHLVERTYANSLDCPPLAQCRTVGEIVQSYRDAEGFAPGLWFTVESVGASGAIGCVLLALHPGPSSREPDQINPACVVELVYMGIVPEHRRRGYARLIMETVSDICQQQGTERLILAVDECNSPAIAAYRRFGMLHWFRETMWGRSV